MDRLWDRLEQVPDHRTLKGWRYSLAAIVGISLAAMLSGANDLRAIFRWGRRLTPKGLAAFGIGRGRAPCHATYHYVFRSIAAAGLERALRGSVPSGSAGHVAIDGKRLRGSQSENSPGIHVRQAFSTGLQASIGALAVPPDSAEVIEDITLLKGPADRHGRYRDRRCRFHLSPDRRSDPGQGGRLFPVCQSQPARTPGRDRARLRRRFPPHGWPRCPALQTGGSIPLTWSAPRLSTKGTAALRSAASRCARRPRGSTRTGPA